MQTFAISLCALTFAPRRIKGDAGGGCLQVDNDTVLPSARRRSASLSAYTFLNSGRSLRHNLTGWRRRRQHRLTRLPREEDHRWLGERRRTRRSCRRREGRCRRAGRCASTSLRCEFLSLGGSCRAANGLTRYGIFGADWSLRLLYSSVSRNQACRFAMADWISVRRCCSRCCMNEVDGCSSGTCAQDSILLLPMVRLLISSSSPRLFALHIVRYPSSIEPKYSQLD